MHFYRQFVAWWPNFDTLAQQYPDLDLYSEPQTVLASVAAFLHLCYDPVVVGRLKIDQSFQAFVVEKMIGSGSFGNVYRVRSRADGQLYAVRNYTSLPCCLNKVVQVLLCNVTPICCYGKSTQTDMKTIIDLSSLHLAIRTKLGLI